jgi:NAD(P)-dependent dehydrogenase (short-subunit alcohol dehydrogenase family)
LKDPQDRKAIVSGGASGFGRAVVKHLRAKGAHVAAIDVNGGGLEELVRDDPAIFTRSADVTDKRAITEAVAAVAKEFSGIDTVVACAGVWNGGPSASFSEEQWDRILDVNLKGAFLLVQAAIPWLVASGRGRVVAISSDAGLKGFPERAAYCASKFGLIGLCESLAAELADSAVTVNAVCPSWCPETGMGTHIAKQLAVGEGTSVGELISSIEANFPLGKSVQIEDVVATIAFLASDDASMLTGQALEIDGGVRYGAFRSTPQEA